MPRPLMKTVLMIDDDTEDQDLFREAFAEIAPDTYCVFANDGEAGLRYLESDEEVLPDLIFLDLNMPRLNGKQCLIGIKQIERVRAIPVIIYSTSSSPQDREETLALGAAEFVTKPSTFREICKQLSDVMTTFVP